MKILSVSDIHGNKMIIDKLVKIYSESKIDLLLICGDIGGKHHRMTTLQQFGQCQKEDYNYLMNNLKSINKPFYCILGNDDWFEIEDKTCLTTGDSTELYPDIVAFDLVHITPFNTNREVNENKIKYELSKINISAKSIILAHCPPFECRDKIYSGINVGSKSIRKCIEENKPKIWLCGHIHEDFGVSQINETAVFNCACNHVYDNLRGFVIDTGTLEYEKIDYQL